MQVSTFKEDNIVLEEMAAHKKTNKGGSVVRYEPVDLKLVMEDPSFAEAFTNARCMRFCQKLQGYHAQVSKDSAVNFVGNASKVGILSFTASLKPLIKQQMFLYQGKNGSRPLSLNYRIVLSS